MDKQKQIEEMARNLGDGQGYSCSRDTVYCEECILKRGCVPYSYAKVAYNVGYRKIPENAVVIEKSEYEKLRLLADECLEWRRKNCNVGELPKENAVVLTREEYKKLKHRSGTLEQLYNQYPYRVLVGFNSMVFSQDRESYEKLYNEIEEKARKETAEKFAERLKEHLEQSFTVLRCSEIRKSHIPINLYTLYENIDKICKEITEGKV